MAQPPPVQNYQVEYTDEARQFLYRRRAATHAAFLLPHLKPGMRLLDCGCGPGSITVDLAEIIAPGEVIGIDVSTAQLELARTHAAQKRVGNVRFEEGDVRHIPFADLSFDAVFVHGVIGYLPEPVQAFAEIRRVLKLGGVLGSRDSDWGGFLFAPTFGSTKRFFELFDQYTQHCGGQPEFGRHQLAAIRAAGFTEIKASASCDMWSGDTATTHFVANFMATYCLSAEFADPLIHLGFASLDELRNISQDLRTWGEHPDAFAAEPWGEAVAWKTSLC